MKKTIIFLFILSLLFSVYTLPVYAAYNDSIEMRSPIVYMVSLDGDSVPIYDKNSDTPVDPGSLAKIAAAMVVINECTDLDALVTATAEAIRPLDTVNVSTVGILVGEVISVRELLYCMMISNAYDACNVLAYEFSGGDFAAFTDKMNAYAISCGCTNTLFRNPNGFAAEGQSTTAKDIALLYKASLENAFFTRLVGMDYYEMPETNSYHEIRYLHSTNLCLTAAYKAFYSPYIVNGKTGNTDAGLYHFVSTASTDGYSYLCVTMNATTDDVDNDDIQENLSMVDQKDLYAWTYKNVKLRVVVTPSLIVGEVRVKMCADCDYVTLVPKESVSALVPANVDEYSVLVEPIPELTKTEVSAPIHKGDVLGVASIKYADVEIAKVDLVASFDVERSYGKYILSKAASFVTGKAFLTVVFILILAAAVYLVLALFVIPNFKKAEKKSKKDSDK